MNTQSHAIVNLWLLKKLPFSKGDDESAAHLSIVSGAVLPDIPIFIFFIWYTLVEPSSQERVWREIYYREDWQIFFNLFNSIPIYLLAAFLAWYYSKKRFFLFCLSNLLHFLEDFFLHMEDAHANFYPLWDYRFYSGISYWDSRGFGEYVSVTEAIVVLIISISLFRHLNTRWGKTLLVSANVFSFGSHAIWKLIFLIF